MAGNNCLVALVVCSYWLVATTMIFVNKHLMAATSTTQTATNLQSGPKRAEIKYAVSPSFLKESLSKSDTGQLNNNLVLSGSGEKDLTEDAKLKSQLGRDDDAKEQLPDDLEFQMQVDRPSVMKNNFGSVGKIMSRTIETSNDEHLQFSPSVVKDRKASFLVNTLQPPNDIKQTLFYDRFKDKKNPDLKEKLLNDKDEKGPDISVLVVWAQNVFGLTFLLTLRGLVLVLRLPVKELQHLQLPSMARRGDLDLILAAVAQTSALIFNNLTLRLISVSFYQIARALTLVFVTLLSACILRERIAKRVTLACLLMILGFYVGVDQEVLSQGVLPVGVLYGSIASFFAACYGVLFKRLQISSTSKSASSNGTTSSLPKKIWANLNQREKELANPNKFINQQNLMPIRPLKDTSQWKQQDQQMNSIRSTTSRITATTLQFTYYNYLTCSIALAPAVFGSCQARDFICSEASRSANFWCLLALSGIAGIAMSWVSSLQISLTSPLTHNISINAKSVLLTLTAVLWNGEQRTGLWWVGNVLVISGVALYTATKLREQVHLPGDSSGAGARFWPRSGKRLKVPIRLAAVTEDIRY